MLLRSASSSLCELNFIPAISNCPVEVIQEADVEKGGGGNN